MRLNQTKYTFNKVPQHRTFAYQAVALRVCSSSQVRRAVAVRRAADAVRRGRSRCVAYLEVMHCQQFWFHSGQTRVLLGVSIAQFETSGRENSRPYVSDERNSRPI